MNARPLYHKSNVITVVPPSRCMCLSLCLYVSLCLSVCLVICHCVCVHQLVPLLRLLYHAPDGRSNHLNYMALIVILILSEDACFSRSVHEIVSSLIIASLNSSLPDFASSHWVHSLCLDFFVCHCLVCACTLYYCNMVR